MTKAKVITFTNNKGGVGKTSSCTAIGSILGLLGYRVLIIDNDFQANATATFLAEDQDISKTVVDIFRMDKYTKESVEECIVHTVYQNVDLIPACPEHQDTESYLYTQIGNKLIQKCLAKAIRQIREDYDYMLIDTHPDLNVVAKNALCCSDYVITPVRADGYSFQGTAPITNSVLMMSSDEDMNPNLQFLGVFITASDTRTNNFRSYRDFYEEQLGEDFIPITIRRDAAIDAVTSWLKPLPYLLGSKEYRATSKWKGIYDYIELMHEVGMISDTDYCIVRSVFEIADGNIAVQLDGQKIASLNLMDGVEEDFQDDYQRDNCCHYEALLTTVNSDPAFLHAVRLMLLAVMDKDRLIRSAIDGKTPLIKISTLGTKEDL